MQNELAEIIAVDMVVARDASERRTVLAKWRHGAGADAIDRLLPNVLEHLTAMLDAETNPVQRRRILNAVGQVQDQLSR